MTLVSELRLPSFDHTDAEMRGERFHREMARVRAAVAEADAPAVVDGRVWLVQAPFGYMTLDREAGEFFLRTRKAIFPGMKIAEIFGVQEGPLYEQMRRNILHVNGADHTRLRSLVNPALSPRAVERYRPVMREFLDELLAQAVAASQEGGEAGEGDEVRCDFVQAFAKPYPSLAIATVMGAPLQDAPRLHHWSNVIQRQFDAVSMASEIEAIDEAVREFYEYAQALVLARRQDPSDDLISKLIAATAPSEDGELERLSDVECINLVFNVLVGGVDTSQSQLAHAIRLLAQHPEQLALVAANPSLADAAVEEALRYEPITPFTARIAVEDVEHRGVEFPEGTIVMVCAFTGNRDLEAQAAGEHGAQAFDITADRGRARPMTFGAGVHYCLGANLARVELQEGLAFLAQRLHGLRLDGEPVFEGVSGIYGLAELPIAFTA